MSLALLGAHLPVLLCLFLFPESRSSFGGLLLFLYRNSEHYADPTAGAAFAHIAYEERKQRRLAAQKKKKAAEAVAEIRKKEKAKQRRKKRAQQRETHNSTTTWVLAWPKPVVSIKTGHGGNE